jgi:hypothetical protein
MNMPRVLLHGLRPTSRHFGVVSRPNAFAPVAHVTTTSSSLSSPFDQRRSFARGARSRKAQAQPASQVTTTAPPPALREEDAWTAVTDKASGQVYYWNEVTNVTTPLGAPKPGSPEEQAMLAQQQQAGQQPAQGGLGRAVAEGFSFGVGAGIARAAVGSIFGGFGGGDEEGGGGDDGDWV